MLIFIFCLRQDEAAEWEEAVRQQDALERAQQASLGVAADKNATDLDVAQLESFLDTISQVMNEWGLHLLLFPSSCALDVHAAFTVPAACCLVSSCVQRFSTVVASP